MLGVDLQLNGFEFAQHSSFEFVPLDLTDLASVEQIPLEGIDLLYHLAAAGVKAPTRKWSLCVQVNVMGTATLMDVLLRRVESGLPVPRIVYTKTYYEDHLDAIPAFRENPYVVSKVAATRWLEAIAPVYPQSITIAKVFQVYGPGDDSNNVLSYAARTLKAGEKATFGSGSSLRDWIYIDDFIAGLAACGGNHGHGLHRFDLGSGERHTIRQMVEKIAEICGTDESLLEFDPSKDRGDTEVEDWAVQRPKDRSLGYSVRDGLKSLLASI